MTKVLIIVSTLMTHEPEDEFDERWEGPQVPESWELIRQGNTGWFSVRRDKDTDPDRFINLFWVRDAGGNPMKGGDFGVFAACSDDLQALKWLRDNVPFAFTIKEIRTGATAVARRVRDKWFDGRYKDAEGVPLPGQEAVRLWGTVAGSTYFVDAENTEQSDLDV